MKGRDPRQSLQDILDHAREAIEISVGRSRADLDEDRLFELAVTRLLEIVGEAANRVPSDLRDCHPGISWAEVIGMRNRLAHGYDAINKEILWKIIQDDLPALIGRLEEVLEKLARAKNGRPDSIS